MEKLCSILRLKEYLDEECYISFSNFEPCEMD
jgi:hypothetical protein